MAQFFIDRPIFAWVIALFILVIGGGLDHAAAGVAVPAGGAAVHRRQRQLPGASASTLEDSVIAVIEREMNGSPGLAYFESVSQADGSGPSR